MLLGSPTTNFNPLFREQPYSQLHFVSFYLKVARSLIMMFGSWAHWGLSRVWIKNFAIWSQSSTHWATFLWHWLGAGDSVIIRIKNGWSKFGDIVPLLTSKGLLLGAKYWLYYSACVHSVHIMLSRSETWLSK